MRRKMFVSFVLIGFIISFNSCQKEPVAGFTVDKSDVVTGETITFTNTTVDGVTYLWDFGDGQTSDIENPTHKYEEEGDYTVKLSAFSKNGKKTNESTTVINVKKANEIGYDGNKYPVERAYVEMWGNYYGYYSNYLFALYLVDNSIVINDQNTNPTTTYTGEGNLIQILLLSSSNTSLTPGTYYFSSNDVAFTFFDGFMGLGYNLANETGTAINCVGGTVIVSQVGSTYVFDISLSTNEGKIIYGHYEGNIISYDYRDGKGVL
ncbi:MAG TPA: PKD domain-containing protein [Bacteroidales bacterium]|nr:PKD domain-containing protein [Bacteroidales bacterium]